LQQIKAPTIKLLKTVPRSNRKLEKTHLHVSGFMSNYKGRSKTVFVIQWAASQRMTHSCHVSVTCQPYQK